MANIKPPDAINLANFDIANFELWLEAFMDYMALTQKTDLAEDRKIVLFLSISGIEIRKLVKSFTRQFTRLTEIVDEIVDVLRHILSQLGT